MVYRDTVAICSDVHTEHIPVYRPYGQKVDFLIVKPCGTRSNHKVNNFEIMNYELQKEVLQCSEVSETDNRGLCVYNNRSTTDVSGF
jgi:hypothetical protein